MSDQQLKCDFCDAPASPSRPCRRRDGYGYVLAVCERCGWHNDAKIRFIRMMTARMAGRCAEVQRFRRALKQMGIEVRFVEPGEVPDRSRLARTEVERMIAKFTAV